MCPMFVEPKLLLPCSASFVLSHACQFSIRSELIRVWPHGDSPHSRSHRSSATGPAVHAASQAECVLCPLISAASAAGPTSQLLDVANSSVFAEPGLLLSSNKICTRRDRYAVQHSERFEWYSAVQEVVASLNNGRELVSLLTSRQSTFPKDNRKEFSLTSITSRRVCLSFSQLGHPLLWTLCTYLQPKRCSGRALYASIPDFRLQKLRHGLR